MAKNRTLKNKWTQEQDVVLISAVAGSASSFRKQLNAIPHSPESIKARMKKVRPILAALEAKVVPPVTRAAIAVHLVGALNSNDTLYEEHYAPAVGALDLNDLGVLISLEGLIKAVSEHISSYDPNSKQPAKVVKVEEATKAGKVTNNLPVTAWRSSEDVNLLTAIALEEPASKIVIEGRTASSINHRFSGWRVLLSQVEDSCESLQVMAELAADAIETEGAALHDRLTRFLPAKRRQEGICLLLELYNTYSSAKDAPVESGATVEEEEVVVEDYDAYPMRELLKQRATVLSSVSDKHTWWLGEYALSDVTITPGIDNKSYLFFVNGEPTAIHTASISESATILRDIAAYIVTDSKLSDLLDAAAKLVELEASGVLSSDLVDNGLVEISHAWNGVVQDNNLDVPYAVTEI